MTRPDLTSSAAKSVVVPWRLSSWVIVAARPFFSGSPGWVRSGAWIWDFSSTHSTTARSGGSRQRPTISATFSSNIGSFET